ncbi:MAG: type II secretion system protein [Deltaproteobacteria bacterium]|nr:type II secretion system protein [Deltaproteobacteria bacterium]
MRSERGYTLLETLVVLAIVAVISAVAVPQLYKWRQSSLYKEAAWGVVSAFRLARDSALSTNLEHRVEFDIDAKRFRLATGNLSSGSTLWTGGPWTELATEVKWSSGPACDGTADLNVRFKTNGSTDSAAICVKDVENALKYRVAVNATSGRAAID